MLNDTDNERVSNLIFSRKTQIASILFIIFAYIMIYWVAPYFNNESKESTTQSIPKK